jgi:hypothetical protein
MKGSQGGREEGIRNPPDDYGLEIQSSFLFFFRTDEPSQELREKASGALRFENDFQPISYELRGNTGSKLKMG